VYCGKTDKWKIEVLTIALAGFLQLDDFDPLELRLMGGGVIRRNPAEKLLLCGSHIVGLDYKNPFPG
jgi:hypothetical protein